jgi:hypothetical protein
MKYIILTSSIFYLLGLKFTSNIDLNAKFQTDSVQLKTEEIQYQDKKTKLFQEVLTVKKDSVDAPSGGSDELLAPYIKVKMN